jgi:hypothetical protein
MDSLPHDNVKAPLFIGKVKNKNCIELLTKEKFIKSNLEKGEDLCAYERPVLPEGATDNYFLVEVKIS